MNDTVATAPAPAAPVSEPATQSRRYFNQGQLEDLATSKSVLTAARAHPDAMAEQDITADWLNDFEAALNEARNRASATRTVSDDAKQSTAAAAQAAAALVAALKKIQSSAKQKHQMLAEDGDPATNFPTDGYLIGTRLDSSRAILLQSAASLIARAKADSLPGFKTDEKIKAVEDLLKAYTDSEGDQRELIRDKELARLDRDSLVHVINARRSAIQHAADALWPAFNEANRPIRKTFSLPLSRALGA